MRLIGIALRSNRRGQMCQIDTAAIGLKFGVKGDYRGRAGPRQVTILSQESWSDACGQLNIDLPWTIRRANLLVTGKRFSSEDVGRIISIGKVELRITRETNPCHRMEDARAGLREALDIDWRGGVCCRVEQEGIIRIGMVAELS
tara:strand:- start:36 stop:470 length:435 start_codon:yes stop_codon:yes gene_type:complete